MNTPEASSMVFLRAVSFATLWLSRLRRSCGQNIVAFRLDRSVMAVVIDRDGWAIIKLLSLFHFYEAHCTGACIKWGEKNYVTDDASGGTSPSLPVLKDK